MVVPRQATFAAFRPARNAARGVLLLERGPTFLRRRPCERRPWVGLTITNVLRSALGNGEAPIVFEDGRQCRDFVHVQDVARANLPAITADEPFDGPVNVAGGLPRTVGDLADALADAYGPNAARPVVTRRWRLGDVRRVMASPRRAREILGFEAAVPFREGVAELAADDQG